MSAHLVKILDSTLREGEQTPGVVFTAEVREKIARALSDLGVHMIEVGDPSVSPEVREGIRRILSLRKSGVITSEVVVHSRMVKSDIERAAELEPDRVAIYYGVSDIHLKYKHRKTREDALSIIAEHVEYARQHGVKVRFTAEDASRADIEYLKRVVRTAWEAGADRVSLADTVGILTPDSARKLFAEVKAAVPQVSLDAHLHNDLGMAVANAFAAIDGGADVVHTTVNGLGERTGIVPLQVFAVAYYVHRGVKLVRLEKLMEVTRLVEEASGIPVHPQMPVVGDYAFTHKAGVHQAGVLSNPATYEAYPPELIGRTRELTLDRYSGRTAIRARLEKLGVSLGDEELTKIVEVVKQSTARWLRDEDLLEIVERVTGRKVSATVSQRIEAYIWIRVDRNVYTTSVARRVAALEGVEYVGEVTGEYDIVAKVSVSSVEKLNELIESIRSIRGVEATHTMLVLKSFEK